MKIVFLILISVTIGNAYGYYFDHLDHLDIKNKTYADNSVRSVKWTTSSGIERIGIYSVDGFLIEVYGRVDSATDTLKQRLVVIDQNNLEIHATKKFYEPPIGAWIDTLYCRFVYEELKTTFETSSSRYVYKYLDDDSNSHLIDSTFIFRYDRKLDSMILKYRTIHIYDSSQNPIEELYFELLNKKMITKRSSYIPGTNLIGSSTVSWKHYGGLIPSKTEENSTISYEYDGKNNLSFQRAIIRNPKDSVIRKEETSFEYNSSGLITRKTKQVFIDQDDTYVLIDKFVETYEYEYYKN